ncbi:MAG: SGNH/GDSL hydrolase family protein [Candidatus Omnitrophica bacterium]|nr:SGNH/GDSL hydrolase family protein [Candidatus Omnitrophota bacterium]
MIKNILLLLFGILLVVGAGEAVLRTFGAVNPSLNAGLSPGTESCDYRGLRPDDVLNHAHVPGLTFTYTSPDKKEFTNQVHYGVRGFNDEDYPYAKPSGEKRIAVLGDSFVEAIQVKRQDGFTKLMEEGLRRKGDTGTFRVINMGVSGYSPIVEYILFKDIALQYNPDIVIVCFFMNDVYEDSVYKGMALFGDNGLPVAVRSKGFDKTKKLKGLKRAERTFTNGVKNVINKSKFYCFLKERVYLLLEKLGLRSEEPGKNQFFILQAGSGLAEEALWNDTFRYLNAIKSEADRHGVRFLLVSIPLEAELSFEKKDQASIFYFKEKPLTDQCEGRLKDFCGRTTIAYVSLLDEFRKQGLSGLYFKNDGHFNEKGHRQVAAILSEKLRELGWVE